MSFRKKTVGYVSEIDQFLEGLDIPLTQSQKAEIQKYQRIFELRDHPHPEKSESEIWEAF